MPALSVDHIELIVRDVDEFVEFFQKLGFRLLRRTPHHGGSAELQLPGPNQPVFEIHKVQGEENIGVNHIAFKVQNARQAYEELKEKGVSFEAPPTFVEATGRTIVNFRDPDGWRLQLVDAERKLA
ncbi:MAG: VOC family protein [Dehalococcoidia bacterium]